MNRIERIKKELGKINNSERSLIELQNLYIVMVGSGATLGELQEINNKIQDIKSEV